MTIDANVPAEGIAPQKSAIRSNFTAIKNKIDGLPESYTGIAPGTVACVDDSSTTLQVASQGTGVIGFSERQIGHFTKQEIPIGSNASLTMNGHNGCWLNMTNSAAVVLQLEKTADPSTGVQHRFSCDITRPSGGGSVQISSSTLTNQSPNGHTRVSAGGGATILVDANRSIFWFSGQTEA